MWQILLDGAEALGAKMRGEPDLVDVTGVSATGAIGTVTLRRAQAPLSQAFLQRARGQSLYRQTLMLRLQALLGQGCWVCIGYGNS